MKTLLLVIAMSGHLFASQAQIGANAPALGTSMPVDAGRLPNPSRRNMEANAPLLGYVQGKGPADLYAVIGTTSRPQLGGQIETPEGTARIYLAPGQQYSLIERSTDAAVAMWKLQSAVSNPVQANLPIEGAVSHPTLVAFSPRGETAVLFSQADALLQVITDFPVQPRLVRTLPIRSQGDLLSVAVSDDGSLLVAQFDGGIPVYSVQGGPWRTLATVTKPQAWSFVPGAHDLIISDAARGDITLLSRIDEPGTAERVLCNGHFADRILVTKDGNELLAESSQLLLAIHLPSGTVSRVELPVAPALLSLLRGGQTILLSISPRVFAIKAHDLAALAASQP